MAEDNNKKIATISGNGQQAKIGDQMNFAASEAYKMLRTNLMFSFSDTECKVIGVTSSVKSEGKSTTSINLAYALGEQGYKVLFIEADMRMPGISKQLGINPVPGISNLLSGMTNKVADVLRQKVFNNVDFIPAGENVPNPAELLGSDRMKATLDGLQKIYE